jgi:phage terminase large subunit-like protein
LEEKADPRLRGDDPGSGPGQAEYAREIEEHLRTAIGCCGSDERLWWHFLNGLAPRVRRALLELWSWQAHGGQTEPRGPWTVWLLMAGRGFGKTRAGAEWVSARARDNPQARIALVGGSRDEVAKVMIEGPSGLIKVARLGERIEWKPSLGTVRFASGAKAFVYSAEAPEGLRGPEHDFAWADELAKWGAGGKGRSADAAWDNLMLGLRRGDHPRVVVTTTPRSTPLVQRVRASAKETGGRTADNVHLPDAFVAWMQETYGGTRLGRQELDGELIAEVEGALFTREVLEKSRAPALTLPSLRDGPLPLPQAVEGLVRIVVGVDPPASTGGTCGIVVCGAGADGVLYVLADASIGGASPERWAKAVAAAAEAWGADRVIAEKNMGGDMVGEVLRGADVALPVRLVSASRGKVARAEPVAALFENGRAKLAGRFPELEDELAGMLIGGEYAGPGRSPDRADACVWALTALMKRGGEPRISAL